MLGSTQLPHPSGSTPSGLTSLTNFPRRMLFFFFHKWPVTPCPCAGFPLLCCPSAPLRVTSWGFFFFTPVSPRPWFVPFCRGSARVLLKHCPPFYDSNPLFKHRVFFSIFDSVLGIGRFPPPDWPAFCVRLVLLGTSLTSF